MNDERKRGRPKKHTGDDVKINVRVDRLLWEAVNDPKYSQSYNVTRALRRCLNEGRQDNLASIKIALREARKEIAHGNLVVTDCYERIRRMGLDPDEIEESLRGDENNGS